MRTEAHWEESKESESFREANQIALTLKELARNNGYDPKGIKILTKGRIIDSHYGRANSLVIWTEGPENWAYDFIVESISCVPYNETTLVFYDI